MYMTVICQKIVKILKIFDKLMIRLSVTLLLAIFGSKLLSTVNFMDKSVFPENVCILIVTSLDLIL